MIENCSCRVCERSTVAVLLLKGPRLDTNVTIWPMIKRPRAIRPKLSCITVTASFWYSHIFLKGHHYMSVWIMVWAPPSTFYHGFFRHLGRIALRRCITFTFGAETFFSCIASPENHSHIVDEKTGEKISWHCPSTCLMLPKQLFFLWQENKFKSIVKKTL